jgi:hypothetical protein
MLRRRRVLPEFLERPTTPTQQLRLDESAIVAQWNAYHRHAAPVLSHVLDADSLSHVQGYLLGPAVARTHTALRYKRCVS